MSGVVCGQRASKKEQAVESQLLRLSETVAIRFSGGNWGEAPRVDDALGERLVRLQGSDQGIIVLNVCWCDFESPGVHLLKIVTGSHRSHVMAGRLQPCSQNRGEATGIREDKPASGLLHLQSCLLEADGIR